MKIVPGVQNLQTHLKIKARHKHENKRRGEVITESAEKQTNSPNQ